MRLLATPQPTALLSAPVDSCVWNVGVSCAPSNATSSDHTVQTSNIFLGVGSDEAIDLVIRVACVPRVDSILITSPTYGMYQVCANIHDVAIISVPLNVETPSENPKGLKVRRRRRCKTAGRLT